jgi:hypothetical protein
MSTFPLFFGIKNTGKVTKRKNKFFLKESELQTTGGRNPNAEVHFYLSSQLQNHNKVPEQMVKYKGQDFLRGNIKK